jgi:hypothetical protein
MGIMNENGFPVRARSYARSEKVAAEWASIKMSFERPAGRRVTSSAFFSPHAGGLLTTIK